LDVEWTQVWTWTCTWKWTRTWTSEVTGHCNYQMSGNHDASYLHKIKSTYINVDFDQSKKPLTWTP
jgi:hypothetical protein